MRKLLLDACTFNWETISPAIFGSLFQVVLKKKRRAQGAHYTTEKNILKVIQPLFLDVLRAEFDRLRSRRDTGKNKALEQFHDRLAALRFLDPACGCGNFLIISYRELRMLEIDLLKELHSGEQLQLDVSTLSKLNVDQFYGIEINEFPARIAEVALWMMDHIMNVRLSFAFGDNYARIPLVTAPNILQADALEMDWNTLLPSSQCSFVLGNPPFIGCRPNYSVRKSGGLRAFPRPVRSTTSRHGSLRPENISSMDLPPSHLSQPTPSHRENRSRNSGRFCFTTADWRLHLHTEPSPGEATPEVWLMSMLSSWALHGVPRRPRKSAYLAMTTLTATQRRHTTHGSPRTSSMAAHQ